MTDMDGEAVPRDGVGNSGGQGHRGRKPLHQVGEKGKVAHVFGSQLDPRVAGEKGKKWSNLFNNTSLSQPWWEFIHWKIFFSQNLKGIFCTSNTATSNNKTNKQKQQQQQQQQQQHTHTHIKGGGGGGMSHKGKNSVCTSSHSLADH